jgi:multidrug efflux system outer membrane protein
VATGGSRLGRLLDNPLYSLAAALAPPIFDAGRLVAGQDLAQARRAELLAQYRAAIVAAVGDVELALQAVAGTQLQQMAQSDVVEQAQQAAILAQARYRAGAETLLTLLDAQRTLYAAQDVAAQLRLAAWADRVALHRAVGGGWAKAEVGAEARADVAAPLSGGSVQVFAGPRP